VDSTIYVTISLVIFLLVILVLLKPRRSYQVALINSYRRKYRLRPLRAYFPLDVFARKHTSYLARNRSCNHDRFEIRSAMIMKITRTDYVGENCIMYPSREYNDNIAVRLIEDWMDSPEHRTNILNPKFSKIGVSVVVKGQYVYSTQIFCS